MWTWTSGQPTNMTDLEMILRMAAAMGAGAVIGLERQRANKLAGTKTNALVCVGACLFTIIGVILGGTDDSARIVGQIASGIGFLGAGAILRDGTSVKGLTTAATVWCAAAVGALIGIGQFKVALVASLFILLCNLILRPVSNRIFPRPVSDPEEDSTITRP